MIQRIQTVYLVLGGVALGALLLTEPVMHGAAAVAHGWFTPVVIGLAALADLVALGAVFLYNNRPLQRKVIVLAQGLTVLLLVALFGGLYLADALFVRTTQGIDTTMLVTLLLPILAYVFFMLARRGVTKDIELVKSMDRLR